MPTMIPASAPHTACKTLLRLFQYGLAMALLGLAGAAAHAKIIEEIIKVPVKVTNGYGKVIEHEAVVTLFFDDATPKTRPIAVINHGRAAKPEQMAAMGRVRYSGSSAWLARMGFLVVVPTRVGYGETGGEDAEDTGACNRKNYPPGYEAAAQTTLQVLQHVRQRPDALKDRSIVLGQSFGGATSVTLAAKNPPGVQAIVNFAGGGGGNAETKPQDPCAPNQLRDMFATYGETAKTPILWAYAENDMWFGPKYPKEWFDAFKAKGGVGEFVLFPPHGKDGHGLFSNGPEVWRPRVLDFLKSNGYPELKAPEVKP